MCVCVYVCVCVTVIKHICLCVCTMIIKHSSFICVDGFMCRMYAELNVCDDVCMHSSLMNYVCLWWEEGGGGYAHMHYVH